MGAIWGQWYFPMRPEDIPYCKCRGRARRRYLQLKGKVDGVSLSSLLDEIRARDERDTQRAVAPLKPAVDAIQLDSTELSIEQVLERILSEIAIRDIAG